MQKGFGRSLQMYSLTTALVLAKAALPDLAAAQDTIYVQAPPPAQTPVYVQVPAPAARDTVYVQVPLGTPVPPQVRQPQAETLVQETRYVEQTRYVEAPPPILVTPELKSMSEGSFNSFSTTVEGADKKLAASVWKDLMKEYGGKVKRSKPESLKAEAVVVRSIGGSDPVDVYADFDERGNDVLARIWVRYRGEFIGPVSAQRDIEATERLLTEYHVLLRRAVVNEELETEQKQMARLEKELANTLKDIERAERDIENARRDIERANQTIENSEANIKAGQAETANKQTEIEKQAEAVRAVQDKLALIKA